MRKKDQEEAFIASEMSRLMEEIQFAKELEKNRNLPLLDSILE